MQKLAIVLLVLSNAAYFAESAMDSSPAMSANRAELESVCGGTCYAIQKTPCPPSDVGHCPSCADRQVNDPCVEAGQPKIWDFVQRMDEWDDVTFSEEGPTAAWRTSYTQTQIEYCTGRQKCDTCIFQGGTMTCKTTYDGETNLVMPVTLTGSYCGG
jgi:hypothetical protein